MKETIYLVADRAGVRRMTKRLPDLGRGEIPVKLELVIEDSAFRQPVLTRQVVVSDWREGIDIADIELRELFITEAEAELIRAKRLAEMERILMEHGRVISVPCTHGDDCTAHPGGIGCDN